MLVAANCVRSEALEDVNVIPAMMKKIPVMKLRLDFFEYVVVILSSDAKIRNPAKKR